MCEALAAAQKLQPTGGDLDASSARQYAAYAAALEEAAQSATDAQLAQALNSIAAVNKDPAANSAQQTKDAFAAAAAIAPRIQDECGIDILSN